MSYSDKFSVPALFKECPSYGYMYAIHRGHLLTTEDMIIIHRILIGCSKLVSVSRIEYAKKAAKRVSKLSRKELVYLSSVINLTMTVKGTDKFRPSDLRTRLPDHIKNIQAADLSGILKSLCKITVLMKTERDTGRRGSPLKESQGLKSQPGSKSFYQPTEYLDTLKQVITKSIARKLLFAFIVESKLIHNWLHYICLLGIYQLRFSNIDTIIDTILSVDRTLNVKQEESELEKLYEKQKMIACQYDDTKLERIARERAIVILQHHAEYEDLITNLYISGGIFFFA